MEICNILVISVITRQHGKEISNTIWTLFMEMYGTLVINATSRQDGNEGDNMYRVVPDQSRAKTTFQNVLTG